MKKLGDFNMKIGRPRDDKKTFCGDGPTMDVCNDIDGIKEDNSDLEMINEIENYAFGNKDPTPTPNGTEEGANDNVIMNEIGNFAFGTNDVFGTGDDGEDGATEMVSTGDDGEEPSEAEIDIEETPEEKKSNVEEGWTTKKQLEFVTTRSQQLFDVKSDYRDDWLHTYSDPRGIWCTTCILGGAKGV